MIYQFPLNVLILLSKPDIKNSSLFYVYKPESDCIWNSTHQTAKYKRITVSQLSEECKEITKQNH